MLTLPLLITGVFWHWLARHNVDLETGARCWDVFIKFISAVTVVVSGAMLFGKYIDDQSQLQAVKSEQLSRELALREAEYLRQKLLFETQQHDRQRALLTEAKTVAARIASMQTPDHSARTRFEELYHADLIGVERLHGPVEAAMVRFRQKLKGEQDAPEESLYDLSLSLSRSVEVELKESLTQLLTQHLAIAELLKPKADSAGGRP